MGSSYDDAAAKKRRRRQWSLLHRWTVGGLCLLLLWFWRRPREACPRPVAKVFTFHKDEESLIRDWVVYHGSTFGIENLVVIDHDSTNEAVVNILERYRRRGLTVVPFRGSFRQKAEALSAAMRSNAANADFLIPIDVDEFIVDETGDVIATLRQLAASNERRKFKFSSRVSSCRSTAARPVLETKFSAKSQTSMAKTFFRARGFVATDQGNHYGWTDRDNGTHQDVQLGRNNFDTFFASSPLTLLHFAMRDFDTWHVKLFQRARAYGFSMETRCEGVRRGQRYCRSYQALRGGQASIDEARREYAAVCAAIAQQQNRLAVGSSSVVVAQEEDVDRVAAFFRGRGDIVDRHHSAPS